MTDAMIFVRMFLRYPAMLGSVWPSSGSLCSRLMRLADWSQTRCSGIRPGRRHYHAAHSAAPAQRWHPHRHREESETGSTSARQLRRRRPATENRAGFCCDVRKILTQHQITAADCIVSGVPFSLLPPREVQRILKGTRESLGPNGKLLIYQFSNAIEPALRRSFQTETQWTRDMEFPAGSHLRCKSRLRTCSISPG